MPVTTVRFFHVSGYRPFLRQAGHPCPRATLGVEQPMPRICVHLAAHPHVFRHLAQNWLRKKEESTTSRIIPHYEKKPPATDCGFSPLSARVGLGRMPQNSYKVEFPVFHLIELTVFSGVWGWQHRPASPP